MKKIAVLQIDSALGDTQSNLNKIDCMLGEIKDPDIRMAVFCEYGTSGYCTDQSLVARPIPGETVTALERIAKAHNIWLSGGTSELVGDRVANTSVMISPVKGMVAKYRKMHPFGDERERLAMGNEPVVVDTELGRVGLTICFDFTSLNYPASSPCKVPRSFSTRPSGSPIASRRKWVLNQLRSWRWPARVPLRTVFTP